VTHVFRLRTKLGVLKCHLAELHKASWDESKHPRGEHGRFASAGAGLVFHVSRQAFDPRRVTRFI
jgi:hypothetical protein